MKQKSVFRTKNYFDMKMTQKLDLNTLVVEAIVKHNYSLDKTIELLKDRFAPIDIVAEYVRCS